MNTHYMNLWSSSFYMIVNGIKTIELRLNDEKRQQVNIGDIIIFKCTKNDDTVTTKVKELHKFADFKQLYQALPLDKCGYSFEELDDANYTDMYDYYTKEQIDKYGVLGIELCDISYSKKCT